MTLACALYVAGGVSATWPAVLHARTHFLSGGASGHGEASPGDHLQTLYHWWLVGSQLAGGHAPWLDPYSFRPETGAQPNFPGWPFGFVFWPLAELFGLVVGWNLMQIVCYALAGLLACAWLRELDLPRAPALVGGLVFAIAPYRVSQSVGHLLGPISVLLPLSLWAVERARRGSAWWLALAAAALASIPLSGQVHLALGAIPFVIAYAVVRVRRAYAAIAAAATAAIGAGILVRQTVIARSTQAAGRSLDEVTHYSANWGDFVARHIDHARSEQYTFLGWVTPLAALAGLVLLVRARRFALAALLGLGALVPILLAVGTHLPVYGALWHALPPFRFPRVPERLLPIACLCIAALVSALLARSRWLMVSVVAIPLVFLDLHARVYGQSTADDGNAAYAVLKRDPPGRLLELPVFDPGVHYGSVYLWYDTVARKQRPSGYSTTAPTQAKALARRLERLNCGDWSGNTALLLRRLGVTSIAFHDGLFRQNGAVPDRRYFALRGLAGHGWKVQARDGVVSMLGRGAGARPAAAEPPRARPVFCQGWYGNTGAGWPMSETHAPFWIYGAGTLKLRVGAPESLYRVRPFTVDGRRVRGDLAGGLVDLPLGNAARWHVVTLDVEHLVEVKGRKIGLTLLSVKLTSPSRDTRSRRTSSSR